MTWPQWVVSGAILLNSIAFILATKVVFRADKAEALSYTFMASFLAILGATVWFLLHYPSHQPLRLGSAFVLALISCWVFFWSSKTIRKRPFTVIFSPDVPQFLNQDGPYGYVRHPFYTSYLCNFYAAAIMTEHMIAPIATSAAITAIYFYAAHVEENKFCQSSLRAEYQAYQGRTGKFFPRLMRR